MKPANYLLIIFAALLNEIELIMNKTISAKLVLLLSGLVLIAFISCKEDNEQPDFKKNRIIFMSNDVTMRIVRPAIPDTIIYKDSTSGFTMNIENGKLTTRSFDLNDTITFHKQQKDMRITMEFDNFLYNGTLETFGFDGQGVLYLKDRGTKKWQDTIPLTILPVSGRIDGNKVVYTVMKDPGANFQDPYLALYYIGSRIY